MSDVRWEPVGNNERIPAVGRIAAMLPDGYALCRATPAATWSQEPPDAEGDWWLWRESDSHPRYLRVYADPHHPEDWTVGGAGQMPYPISRTEPIAHYWWLPATVPPPPRT